MGGGGLYKLPLRPKPHYINDPYRGSTNSTVCWCLSKQSRSVLGAHNVVISLHLDVSPEQGRQNIDAFFPQTLHFRTHCGGLAPIAAAAAVLAT